MSNQRGKRSRSQPKTTTRQAPPKRTPDTGRQRTAKRQASKRNGAGERKVTPAITSSNRISVKVRLLAMVSGMVWLASVVNAVVPMLRCTAAWADKVFFLTFMLLPWSWVRPAWSLRDLRWRIAATGVVVTCGILGPWFAWRAGAWTVDRKVIERVTLSPGGEVVAYEERDPGSKHVRMLVRHERPAVLGTQVVRELARHNDAHGARLEMLGADTIRIRPGRLLGEVPVIDCKLKPWVWR